MTSEEINHDLKTRVAVLTTELRASQEYSKLVTEGRDREVQLREKQLELQAKEHERRLDELNHHTTEMRRVVETNVAREEWDDFKRDFSKWRDQVNSDVAKLPDMKAISASLKDLEGWQAKVVGYSVGISFGISFAIALVTYALVKLGR